MQMINSEPARFSEKLCSRCQRSSQIKIPSVRPLILANPGESPGIK